MNEVTLTSGGLAALAIIALEITSVIKVYRRWKSSLGSKCPYNEPEWIDYRQVTEINSQYDPQRIRTFQRSLIAITLVLLIVAVAAHFAI